MSRPTPPASVREAFSVSSGIRYNHGNFGGVWSDGTVVLKEVADVTETTAVSELLESIEFVGVRIPRPVRSSSGEFVVDGWSASEHVAGRHLARGMWPERVAASRAISSALRHVARPTFFDTHDHVWARGAHIAWDEMTWTPPAEWAPFVDRLRSGAESVDPPRQLVHGDIAGNVINAPGQPLGVVDFSATWQSALWSDCMVITDGLLWFGAPTNIVDLLDDNDSGAMLCRTTLFRLVVHCLWNEPDVPTEVANYSRVVDIVTAL